MAYLGAIFLDLSTFSSTICSRVSYFWALQFSFTVRSFWIWHRTLFFCCLYNLWHIAKKSNSRIQRFIGLFKSVYFVEVHVNSTAKKLAYHSIFARIRENSFVSGIEKAKWAYYIFKNIITKTVFWHSIITIALHKCVKS